MDANWTEVERVMKRLFDSLAEKGSATLCGGGSSTRETRPIPPAPKDP